MSSKDSFIEVPPPLYKYEGNDNIHDDNQKILDVSKDSRRVILPKKQVKSLESLLKSLSDELETRGADDIMSRYETLLQQYNSSRLQFEKLRDDYESSDNPDAKKTIGKQAMTLKSKIAEQHALLVDLREQAKPLRQLMIKRGKVSQKLQSHYVAVDESKKELELLKLMGQEAEIIAQQMTQTLSRIGFSHTVTVGKKSKTYYVEFEKVVTTPDQHQFKIAASRRGLAGGSVDLLPNGVRVTDILKESVMRELSVALEREVWSPHIHEDVNNTNGAWVVVERMGLYEGIPKSVTYRQLMARYETADHQRIPIPAGLKKGRRINWTYLDSHSSTHIMFTGITGSGKTNAVQASISAIVEKHSPQDVLFVFVDLKNQGDFKELADAPHVLGFNGKGIISDIPDVVEILKAVRGEMHYRQRHIGRVAKNIGAYNRSVEREDRLPRIVVLFDEYANTRRERFAEEAKIIDDISTEITQLGRASGIHLWLGIQQPRASNMPQALRDNFTTLFVGHQANVGAGQSVTGNRTSLKLPDLPGRMLAYMGWKSFEVQMPLISEDDINRAVKIANDSYGDLEQYQLHYNTDAIEEEAASVAELVIESAFLNFEGALKKRSIWESFKGIYQFSLKEVSRTVDEIIAGGVVNYEGVAYEPRTVPGNFYQLFPVQLDE